MGNERAEQKLHRNKEKNVLKKEEDRNVILKTLRYPISRGQQSNFGKKILGTDIL